MADKEPQEEKTLAQLIEEEKASAEREPEVEEQPEVQEESQEEAASQGSDEAGTQVTDEQTEPAFASYLRKQGFDVSEGVSDEDLFRSVVERLQKQDEYETQLAKEREDREKAQKALDDFQKKSSEQPKQEETKAASVPAGKTDEDIWAPIQEPSLELRAFVEQDPETGLWRSKETYKQYGGDRAAEEFNKYYRTIQRRSQELVRNPAEALMRAGLSKQIEDATAARMAALEEQIKGLSNVDQKAIASLERRQQASEKQGRIDKIWMEVGPKVYKTSVAGAPLRDPISGNFVPTEYGEVFLSELSHVRDRLGVKDEELALQEAMRVSDRFAPQKQTTTEVTPPEEQSKQETGEEKRKRFVERRKTEPEAPTSGNGYTQEKNSRGEPASANLSLLDIARADPEARELLGLK